MRQSSKNLAVSVSKANSAGLLGHATPRTLRRIASPASGQTLCTVCAPNNAPRSPQPPALRSPLSLAKSPNTSRVILPAVFTAGQRRRASVVADAVVENGTSQNLSSSGTRDTDLLSAVNSDDFGPIQEYDRRVDAGLIRNDNHQRGKPPYPSTLISKPSQL